MVDFPPAGSLETGDDTVMQRLVIGIIVGIATGVTLKAHEIANAMRGYNAIGGEFLIIPLAILIALAVYEITQTSRELFWPGNPEIACGEEVNEESGGAESNF